jgi:DNA repair exonuclease SbcCD ATPase subunit
MFNAIEAKDLFSWKELNYEIKNGISQITGFNYDDNTSEGSGKSSIPNILCWTLYGRIPKDAKIDEVVREGCSGGFGKVLLNNGYMVQRSRKPNDLYIGKPTKEGDYQVVKGKDAKETQLLIDKLIGLDFEAFCQTIYFAQNYQNKFVASNETDKAKILSEIQDLTIFDKGRKKAQDQAKLVEIEKLKLDQKIVGLESDVKRLESNAQLIIDFVDRFEKDKTNRLDNINKQIKKIKDTNEELETALEKQDTNTIKEELDNIEEMLENFSAKKIEVSSIIKMADQSRIEKDRLTALVKNLDAKIERALGKLDTMKLPKSVNCPTCGQMAAPEVLEKHQRHVAEQKAELVSEIEEMVTEHNMSKILLEEMEEAPSVDDAKKILTEIDKETRDFVALRGRLMNAALNSKRLETELKEGKARVKTLQKEKSELEDSDCFKEFEKLEKINNEITSLRETVQILGFERADKVEDYNNLEILKTGFREVKQYIFQSLLAELSRKSTELASELFELPISINFSNEDDEGSVSKILTTVTLDGNARSLGLYSGGQYRRIELAVDLALASIVANRSANPINFRILDEPFKDLSESSMEKMVKLLEKLKGSTIIIEHNSITKSIIHNEFHVEYRGGISRAA